jgi:hypothetical protein
MKAVDDAGNVSKSFNKAFEEPAAPARAAPRNGVPFAREGGVFP